MEPEEPNYSALQMIALKRFLIVIGYIGCATVAFFATVLPLVSPIEPKLRDSLQVAVLGIPFLTYIIAIRFRWRRSALLSIGTLAHLPWLLFVRHPGDSGQFLIGAAFFFATFLWYAFKLEKSLLEGSSSD